MEKLGLGRIICLVALIFLSATCAFASVEKPVSYKGAATAITGYHHRNDADVAQKYRKDEIIVKFKAGVPENRKNNLHAQNGSSKIKDFGSLRLHQLKIKKGLPVADAVALYKKNPDVEYAEPNYLLKAQTAPDDPQYGGLWGMPRISAPTAWDMTTGSNAVVVAVIDSGIDYTHPDLAGNIWVNAAEIAGNNIDDDGNGYVDDVYGINVVGSGPPMDDNGHGTHVGGTIGAVGNNGIGVAGLNWEVRIVPCKFLDGRGYGFTDGAIQCLQYVQTLKSRGVNVVATNNSWGGDGYSQALADAIAAQSDILFIAAAGNNGSSNDTTPFYPAAYTLPNLLAAAATDAGDNRASFSNYGAQTVHVGAPGEGILSTLPANAYGTLSGTSMAAPHVTGLAALLKAHDPGRDWRAIRNLILSGGDAIAPLAQTTISGRRINAVGSLACSDRPLFALLKHPETITVGVPVTLSVLSIDCGQPAGPVTVTATGGEVVTMTDDGLPPDQAAGDGLFSGVWIPSQPTEALTFFAPGAEKTVEFPPLKITTLVLPEGSMTEAYAGSLTADGGFAPYHWAIAGGNLPPGLILESNGTILGTPAANGTYDFAAQVTDGLGVTVQKDLSISVLNHAVLQSWLREYVTTSNQFGTPAGDVATDVAGNTYVTGNYYGFWHMPAKAWVAKYDAAGTLLWQRTEVGGNAEGTYKALDAVAVDRLGNLYGSGYVNSKVDSTLPPDSWLTVKYDASGNVLWDRSQVAGIDGAAQDVAVDGDGNVYVTGYGGRGVNSYTGVNEAFIVTAKYDTYGTLLWTRQYGEDNSRLGYGIAVDPGGNSYVVGSEYIIAGGDSWFDLVVLKYDPAGNLLWAQQYYPPAGYNYHAEAVAIDGSGNLYVEGTAEEQGAFLVNHYLTLKCDPAGNLLWSNTYQVDRGYARDIAVDASGNSYVTGDFFVNGDPDGVREMATIKYDPAGNLVWVKNYYHPDYIKTWSSGIATNPNGNLSLVGFSYDNGVDVDFLTINYAQLPLFPLDLDLTGDGAGSVMVVPGENCSTDWTQYFRDGTQVTLTAVPAAANSLFAGWGGACGGSGDCTLLMTAAKQVTASFVNIDPPVTTASPAGGRYSAAQTVTLTTNKPATIYYTRDGSTPTTASLVYSAPLTIATSTTLKFFARDLAGNSESVRTEVYVIEPVFLSPVNYATGYYPVALATADFNGDGKADLASANQNANSVSVLLGRGDGTFQPKVDYGAGTRPNSITTADFNGDGRGDLAVVNIDSNNLSVLAGNGDGTFAAKVDVSVGSSPSAVVSADFNGDGRADLAVSYYSLNVVSLLLGNGNGTFQSRIDYGVGTQPQSLTAGDFNGDGRIDLAAANYSSNTVSILRANGDGTFQQKIDYGVGTAPSSIATADINGDGKLDLAVTNWTGYTVSVLLGNGDCSFQAATSYPVGKWPTSITAKDFTLDGKVDLTALNSGLASSNISVLAGNGNGTFQSKADFNAGAYSRGAASADFNGDGKLDLAVANPGLFNLSILLNNSNPPVAPLTLNLTVTPPSPQPQGTAITLTATATGGSGTYGYQFWYRPESAATFTLAQDYSPNGTYDWNTATLAAGNYLWQAFARNAGSTAPYEAISPLVPFTLSTPPVATVTLAAAPPSPQPQGTAITLTATATGGSGSYEYQFWYRDTWSADFTMARDYAPSNLFIWDTASAGVANYEWKVYARNAGSTAPFEAVSPSLPYTINSVPPVSSVSLTAAPDNAQVKGFPVTFTATATGGSGTYEYQFWYRAAGSFVFTMARDYGSSSQFIWDTALASPGSYEWKAFARNAGYTVSAGSEILPYTISTPPVATVTLAAAPPSPQLQGTTVTFTATATGGSGSYEYQFWYRVAGATGFTLARDYDTAATLLWNTTAVAVGSYEWQVNARNAASSAPYEATSAPMTYAVSNPPVTSVTFSASPSSPQKAGTAVTLSARARGGVSPYQYRFVVKDGGGTVIVDSGYGSASKYLWNTSGLPGGIYRAEVMARSAGNSSDYEAVSSTTYQLTNPPVTAVMLAATPASPQPRGASITFSGQATGGVAPYQYQFIVKSSKGKTVAASGYSTAATWVWSTTTSLAAGTYTVEVDARSAGSTATKEASATAPYVLN